MKFTIQTLGCRLNQSESDQIAEKLVSAGFVFTDSAKKSDLAVINTCSVTHKADRESRRQVRSLKKQNKNLKIIACGCSKLDLHEIDLNITDKDKLTEEVINFFGKPKGVEDNKIFLANRTRALIKIQEGCDNFCTYCIVPHLRGTPQSMKSDDIIAEINKKVEQGFQEAVLTGVNIGKYQEGNLSLTLLIKRILLETKIYRLRLSSINPEDIDDDFIELFNDKRLCRHLHMSLQSGSDTILKHMARKYDSARYMELITKIYNKFPDYNFTTDVIVGFPGETYKEFRESRELVREVGFLKIHVFRYSKRKGTKAILMKGQVGEDEKKARAAELREVASEVALTCAERFANKKFEVLFEESRIKNEWRGYASNYLRIKNISDNNLTNKLKEVTITKDNILI